MRASQRVGYAFNLPDSFDSTKSNKFERLFVVYVPCGRFFEGGVSPAFVESIFISGVESIQKPDRDQSIACRTTTSRLLTLYKENCESRIKFVRERTALDV